MVAPTQDCPDRLAKTVGTDQALGKTLEGGCSWGFGGKERVLFQVCAIGFHVQLARSARDVFLSPSVHQVRALHPDRRLGRATSPPRAEERKAAEAAEGGTDPSFWAARKLPDCCGCSAPPSLSASAAKSKYHARAPAGIVRGLFRVSQTFFVAISFLLPVPRLPADRRGVWRAKTQPRSPPPHQPDPTLPAASASPRPRSEASLPLRAPSFCPLPPPGPPPGLPPGAQGPPACPYAQGAGPLRRTATPSAARPAGRSSRST